jgi:hypothetical protein
MLLAGSAISTEYIVSKVGPGLKLRLRDWRFHLLSIACCGGFTRGA